MAKPFQRTQELHRVLQQKVEKPITPAEAPENLKEIFSLLLFRIPITAIRDALRVPLEVIDDLLKRG